MMNKTKKTKPEKPLIYKRIGILGKGGSGKSTLTVLLSQVLRDEGYQVCILDADSSNIGLHQALGFKKMPASLLDYFGGTEFSGGLVSCPVDNPTVLPKSKVFLNKLPDKYYCRKPGLTLLTVGKIGDKEPGAGCDGPISKITRDLKIQDIGEFPITLIDIKAGLEDFSRGIVTSMDWILVIVDPSMVAIGIAINIKNLIDQIKKGKSPATKHLKSRKLIERANKIYQQAKIKGSSVLLNKINNPKTADYIKKKLKVQEIEPIGIIPEVSSLSFSWLKGQPLKAQKIRSNLKKIVKQLEKVFHG